MNKETAVLLFETLSSGIRLDIFRLLAPHGEAGQVAGEIVAQLGLPPTNVSFHLKAMTRAGLLHVRQEGRFQRYRADAQVMQDLIAWLGAECAPPLPVVQTPARKPRRPGRQHTEPAGPRVASSTRRARTASTVAESPAATSVPAPPPAPNLTFDF